jgi:Response regulators consisting of a CheY-like receiver domain and a winged-helix DNA-binding domain
MRKILIVEDDAAILCGLSESLNQQHYEIETATDGEEGFKKARKKNVDLIVLDLMLPKMNGEEICRKLRDEGVNTPIMILTSKNEEASKVLVLELGADDYVTKPFSLLELQARVKALLRRGTSSVEKVNEFLFGNVKVDFKKHEVVKKGKKVKLTEREFKLLKYLIEHRGEVITRDMLLDQVWGYDSFPTTRTVDNYILSIRHKIEDNPSRPKFILTVHTSGYKFNY